jgi:tetratricopeptide (TPR) repeat protein
MDCKNFSAYLRECEYKLKYRLDKALTLRFVDYTHEAPAQPQQFIGRDAVVARIKNIVDSPKSNMVVVLGIPGIGKTALALKIIDDYRDKKNLYWYRVREWTTINNIIVTLSEFLKLARRPKLASYLSRVKPLTRKPDEAPYDFGALSDAIEHDFADLNAILVFDDVHLATADVIRLFRIFIDILERVRTVTIVVLLRHAINFYDRKDVVLKTIVREIKLGFLDMHDSRKLIGMDIDDETFNRIYELTSGIPLLLKLLSSAGDRKILTDMKERHIDQFIDTEIISNLSASERTVLEIISTYRLPVPSDAILIAKNTNYDAITGLIRKLLVIELPKRNFDVHEVIRKFTYARIAPSMRIEYHRAAADYYVRQLTELDKHIEKLTLYTVASAVEDTTMMRAIYGMEALYHLQHANEWVRAAELANSICPEWVKQKLIDLTDILYNFSMINLPRRLWADILRLRADWAAENRHWHNAISNYRECIGALEADGASKDVVAHVYTRLAKVQQALRQWQATIRAHQHALKIFESAGDTENIAKKLLDLGLVYKTYGKLKKAEAFYRRCLLLLKDSDAYEYLVVLYHNFAKLYEALGNWRLARTYMRRSLTVARAMGDAEATATVLCSLAEMDVHKHRFVDAIAHYQEALGIFMNTNRYEDAVRTAILIGDLYEARGARAEALTSYEQAVELYKRAHMSKTKFFGLLRLQKLKLVQPSRTQYIMVAELYDKLASIYRNMRNWSKCIHYDKLAIESFANSGLQQRFIERYLLLGNDYDAAGDIEQALVYYQKGLDILKTSIKSHSVRYHDKRAFVAFNLNLARVYERKHAIRSAIDYYKSCVPILKELRDTHTLARVLSAVRKLSKY